MNIALEYLYRDAGNNKLWNAVIFPNRNGLAVEELEARIRASLIDGLWFVAQEIGLPALRFEKMDLELDHDWHEFHGLLETIDGVSCEEIGDIDGVVRAFEASKQPAKYGHSIF